nr:MAG TPA: hypothetical protein [Caudoviricetes sp.]
MVTVFVTVCLVTNFFYKFFISQKSGVTSRIIIKAIIQ